ncbi:GIY-YIG nuclease family protein [Granulosicoccaceae sp. 1_MG-2023]|nr:GIY-YIG nuclease family protein [Granulosicoccaceae sp. 1_MG-2023]
MNENRKFGRTIQLFLVDGDPIGLRKASIHGWTGVLFVSGDATFGELTARAEVDRTGVYILSGPDPDKPGTTRVYIGSGNSVAERIEQSAKKRSYWETAITVTTSDDDLSKGHAEYLEARLISLTSEAARVSLDNATQPDTERRRLPEADIANMEQFLANLKIVLPVVGLDMLKPQPSALVPESAQTKDQTEEKVQFEIRHGSGVNATMMEEDGEFIILKDSEALTDTGYVQQNYITLKSDLISKEILVPAGEGRLKFTKPYAFKSPSAAAAVVLDRNSNGRIEWKVKGSKQTYHDWQKSTQGGRSRLR